MLVKHVRDVLNRPYATIVATAPDKIGVSICNEKDRFNKKLGIQIAMGRAEIGHGVKIPNRMDYVYDAAMDEDYFVPISTIIDNAILNMKYRAAKYYKEKV